MLAGISNQTFKRFCQIDDRRDFLVISIHGGEFFGVLQRPFQRDADLERYQLRDAVDETVRLTQDTSRIAYHGFRGHGAEGNDL